MKRFIAWTAPLGLLAAALTWTLGRAEDSSKNEAPKANGLDLAEDLALVNGALRGETDEELTAKLGSEFKLKGAVTKGRSDRQLSCEFNTKTGAASNCRYRFVTGIRIDSGSINDVSLAGAKLVLLANVGSPTLVPPDNDVIFVFSKGLSDKQKLALAKVVQGLYPIQWTSAYDASDELSLDGSGPSSGDSGADDGDDESSASNQRDSRISTTPGRQADDEEAARIAAERRERLLNRPVEPVVERPAAPGAGISTTRPGERLLDRPAEPLVERPSERLLDRPVDPRIDRRAERLPDRTEDPLIEGAAQSQDQVIWRERERRRRSFENAPPSEPEVILPAPDPVTVLECGKCGQTICNPECRVNGCDRPVRCKGRHRRRCRVKFDYHEFRN